MQKSLIAALMFVALLPAIVFGGLALTNYMSGSSHIFPHRPSLGDERQDVLDTITATYLSVHPEAVPIDTINAGPLAPATVINRELAERKATWRVRISEGPTLETYPVS